MTLAHTHRRSEGVILHRKKMLVFLGFLVFLSADEVINKNYFAFKTA